MSAVDVAVGVPEADAGHHGPWALALRRLLRNRTAMASVVVLVVIVVTCRRGAVLREAHRAGRPVRVQRRPARRSWTARRCRSCSRNPSGLGSTPIGPTLGAPLLPRRRLQGRDVMARLLYGGRNSLDGLDRRRAADLADRDHARARRRLLRRLGRRGALALPRHPLGVPGLPAGDRALDGAAHCSGVQIGPVNARRRAVAVAADHHHRRRLRALRRAPGARRGVLDAPPRVHGGRDRGRRDGPAADPRRDAAERAADGDRVSAADDRARTSLTEAALSFLSIGVQPPNASWGTIIEDGQNLLYTRPWVSIAPGC